MGKNIGHYGQLARPLVIDPDESRVCGPLAGVWAAKAGERSKLLQKPLAPTCQFRRCDGALPEDDRVAAPSRTTRSAPDHAAEWHSRPSRSTP